MKNCCFCWSPVADEIVRIGSGRIPAYVSALDPPPRFVRDQDVLCEYAHEECFERAKAAFRAPVAVASNGGAR